MSQPKMPRYRLYFINPTPRHIRDVVDFDAEDDASALRLITELEDGRALELWRGDRLVQARGPLNS
jgi:hypothetical protein